MSASASWKLLNGRTLVHEADITYTSCYDIRIASNCDRWRYIERSDCICI
ncbi:hypothetical protein MSKU9_2302 [Komagataeibacter diospyri]|uniref:Uncharacterized protein n=2 Tax=Komagataeibacter TaxID=1434011 RepID=A0A0N1FR26_9PROT|nr:hypothetical protein GLUCOINTEAF2_0203873 [Komagataeibacter intermedius AF2]GCE84161.1 hypothetical protein MSKU9_2302 [Komagataeibacter diospyri]